MRKILKNVEKEENVIKDSRLKLIWSVNEVSRKSRIWLDVGVRDMRKVRCRAVVPRKKEIETT